MACVFVLRGRVFVFYAAMESYVGGCLCSLRVGGSGGMEVGGGRKGFVRFGEEAGLCVCGCLGG